MKNHKTNGKYAKKPIDKPVNEGLKNNNPIQKKCGEEEHKGQDKNSLDPYVLNSVRIYALGLVKTGYYLFSDLDDLEQEMILYFLSENKKYKYDKNKSSFKHWVNILLQNSCGLLIRKVRIRNKYFHKFSLNDPMNNTDHNSNDDNPIEMIDLIEDDKADTFEEYCKMTQNKKLSVVLNKLPEDLKQLCKLLQTEKNVTEVAKKLSLSRKSIYKKIHKIKKIFKDLGMDY
jgi:RNA polymerase sigma factor (sigma-70 family)